MILRAQRGQWYGKGGKFRDYSPPDSPKLVNQTDPQDADEWEDEDEEERMCAGLFEEIDGVDESIASSNYAR